MGNLVNLKPLRGCSGSYKYTLPQIAKNAVAGDTSIFIYQFTKLLTYQFFNLPIYQLTHLPIFFIPLPESSQCVRPAPEPWD